MTAGLYGNDLFGRRGVCWGKEELKSPWAGSAPLNNDNSRLLGELTDNGKVFGFLKECFLRWPESFLS